MVGFRMQKVCRFVWLTDGFSSRWEGLLNSCLYQRKEARAINCWICHTYVNYELRVTNYELRKADVL